jgi:hypothetical protein
MQLSLDLLERIRLDDTRNRDLHDFGFSFSLVCFGGGLVKLPSERELRHTNKVPRGSTGAVWVIWHGRHFGEGAPQLNKANLIDCGPSTLFPHSIPTTPRTLDRWN